MDQKDINKAAKAHALDELGKEQFNNNKDAVKATTDIFKAGVSWAVKELKKNHQLVK